MSSIVNLNSLEPANVNAATLARVSQSLPEMTAKTRAFDRNNSQTTLSMMSLTMMNGQSPMRMLRQVLAEVEKRKMALAEAQLNHAKSLSEIQELKSQEPTHVTEAEIALKRIGLDMLESKVNGALKDIAVLADAYDNIKSANSIDEWDEETFEKEEKRHHVRRGFELLYRNIIEYGRAKEATIEYLQQYGVHVQVALAEVSGYISVVNDKLKNKEHPDASDMESFFDTMSFKYAVNADIAASRIFGKVDFANPDYMLITHPDEPEGDHNDGIR